MEAKDTVMSPEMKVDILKDCRHRGETMLPKLIINLTEAQAEISFKAGMKQGIWLFAWWKEGVQYVGTSGRTLEEAYKELGIE